MKTCVSFGAVLLSVFLASEARAACTVAATGINFGNYDVFVAAPRDSTGSVTVSCDQSPPTDVTIAIGASATSGGFNPRMMRHASRPDRLNYYLFTNPSMNVIWGDGTAGTSTVLLPKVKKNKPATTTIYGRLPPGQDVSVGTYGDRLTVTITP